MNYRWKTQYKKGIYILVKTRKYLSKKTKRRKTHRNCSTSKAKIAGNSNHYFLIYININGLNFPIKRHRLSDWIHKQNPAFCYMQETHLRDKDRHYLRVKGWEKNFQANSLKKQAGVAILISNKVNFLDKYKILKLNQDQVNHLNNLITPMK